MGYFKSSLLPPMPSTTFTSCTPCSLLEWRRPEQSEQLEPVYCKYAIVSCKAG